jgi:hypothetical protein
MKTKVSEIEIFYAGSDVLRMTIAGDKSYVTVKPVWSAPLTHPGKHLAIVDSKGEEVAHFDDPNELSDQSLAAVREELHRRYLTARVLSISDARSEFGATYWHVDTDRGERDFVTQSLQENVQWLGDHHVLLIDVDGNRFDVPDIRSLDARSREILTAIL